MGFVVGEPKFDARSAELELPNTRRYQRTYLVSWDGPDYAVVVDESMIVALVGLPGYLPAIGSLHPGDPTCSLRRYKIEPTDASGLVWSATAEYDNAGEPFDPDPLSAPPEIKYGGETIDYPILYDFSDTPKPIRNSAGFPFAEPVTTPVVFPTVSIKRNAATSPLPLNLIYGERINSDAFAGAGARRWRMKAIEGSIVYYNGGFYYEHYYSLVLNPIEEWKYRPVDEGVAELVGGNIQQIIDERGNLVTEPWPLNGSGGKLTPPFEADDFVRLEFKTYQEAAFNGLGLPPF